MLEAIADFWKPVKRLQAQMRLKPEELQIGSIIGFGFVPQPALSGRRLTVTAINTYKFGPDILTSFVLSQEKDAGASMIIAETGGEQYIAVSRRISISDRNKIFNHEDIEAAIRDDEAQMVHCKDIIAEYKGWLAPHYKREIKAVKGQLYKGDHRAGIITGQPSLDFSYTLVVSDNNEHALEIERYDDGRIEVYATVYRRMSDIGEVTHPPKKDAPRPDVKLISPDSAVEAPAKASPKLDTIMAPVEKEVVKPVAKSEEAVAEKIPDVQEHAVTTPVSLPEFPAEAVAKKEEQPVPAKPLPALQKQEAREIIAMDSDDTEAAPTMPAIIIQPSNQPYINQEIKAVNNEPSNFVNESIDCELHVANKIIDEAIRNEMRINDVVRRVIGLPVSQQESVQIPVTLTDQDFSLLAIRYGISSSDKEAIKKRIIEDLGDFSGANKQRKAA